MKILAIESSCDETSVALVSKSSGQVEVVSHVTATSLAQHIQTGGVVPEVAARSQLDYLHPTITQTLSEAFQVRLPSGQPVLENLISQIDAIAVTQGPGLVGSLLVGVEVAKTLALIWGKPLIPINHLEGHLYACFIKDPASPKTPKLPALGLIVSGGHSEFVHIGEDHQVKFLGGTRDDAAGECLDKCARLLNLPYPGGVAIARLAEEFRNNNREIKLSTLPRPLTHEETLDFSFSGLKVATSRLVQERDDLTTSRIAAEVEQAVVDVLVSKSLVSVKTQKPKSFLLVGGVAANNNLRKTLKSSLKAHHPLIDFHTPAVEYCTDNAAMIGARACFINQSINPIELKADPGQKIK